MKRFTMILALLLMIAMPMMAERVTPETARKVASFRKQLDLQTSISSLLRTAS